MRSANLVAHRQEAVAAILKELEASGLVDTRLSRQSCLAHCLNLGVVMLAQLFECHVGLTERPSGLAGFL